MPATLRPKSVCFQLRRSVTQLKMVNLFCKMRIKMRKLALTFLLWALIFYVLSPMFTTAPFDTDDSISVSVSTRQESDKMDPVSAPRGHERAEIRKLMSDLLANNKALLAQFSTWCYQDEKVHVHETILQLWNMWMPLIQNIVFTNDVIVKREAKSFRWHVAPYTETLPSCFGPPIVKYLYLDSFKLVDSIFYGFTNSDIAFGNGLLDTLLFLAAQETWKTRPLMVVGRRTNYDFTDDSQIEVPEKVQDLLYDGKLVVRSSDFFFTNKQFPWDKMGNFTVGRPLIVRALVGFAALHNIDIIDTTLTVAALHLTTQDGIQSSYNTLGMECNEQLLLSDEFKNIPLDMGHCECASLETYYDDIGNIQLRSREPDWFYCNKTRVPFANFPDCLLKCQERGFTPMRKKKLIVKPKPTKPTLSSFPPKIIPTGETLSKPAKVAPPMLSGEDAPPALQSKAASKALTASNVAHPPQPSKGKAVSDSKPIASKTAPRASQSKVAQASSGKAATIAPQKKLQPTTKDIRKNISVKKTKRLVD